MSTLILISVPQNNQGILDQTKEVKSKTPVFFLFPVAFILKRNQNKYFKYLTRLLLLRNKPNNCSEENDLINQSNLINGKNKNFLYTDKSYLWHPIVCLNYFFKCSRASQHNSWNVILRDINYCCLAKPMKKRFKLITGRRRLLFLLLLMLLLLPPANLFPTMQTACHIRRSTGTSPLVVHGLPIRSEIPRPSADVSDSCK